MHHVKDVIHHWPAMSIIQNTSQKDQPFDSLFIYTSQGTTLSAAHFLLISQQTFQVSPTIAAVPSLVKKSLCNPLMGEDFNSNANPSYFRTH